MSTNTPETPAEGENNKISKETQVPRDTHVPNSHAAAEDILNEARTKVHGTFSAAGSAENISRHIHVQKKESPIHQTPNTPPNAQGIQEPGTWLNVGPQIMRDAYTKAEPTIVKGKGYAGKKSKEAILAYRKLREKNEIYRTVDSGLRGFGGGIIGVTGSEGAVLAAGSSISSSIALGGSLLTNIAAPIGFPALVPALSLLGRRLYARKMHGKEVADAYEAELNELAEAAYPTKDNDSDDQKKRNAEARTSFIAQFKEAQEDVERTSHGKSHIDTIEEKNLIQIMAKHAHCSPEEVPYLGSEKRYSKYMFAKFREACEKLSKNSMGKSLNDREKAVVDLFHIEVGDTQTDNPEKKLRVLKQLWEVSAEYAKLVAYTHRKNRDAQLNGGILGGVLASSPLLGFAPAIAGAGLYFARKYYTEFRKPKNIEFDSHGHLRVRIDIDEDADDETSLLKKDIFNRKLADTDMTDNHKYWMSLMKLDESILHAPDLTSAYLLGARQQEHVMKILAGKAMPGAKIMDQTKSGLKLSKDLSTMFDIDKYQNSEEEKSQLETHFEIIREAFAMKIKKEWEDHNAHASPSVFKSLRSATSQRAKNAGATVLQEAGMLAVKTAIPGAMAAGAYGILHLAGTSFILNPISTVIPPSFVIGLVAALGGIAHINSRLKEGGINLVNMITGGKKKKVETEKKTETTVTPPAAH